MPQYMIVKLFHSPRPDKKWRVKLRDESGQVHEVDFGAEGYKDFTLWHQGERDAHRLAYLKRHSGMGEDWSIRHPHARILEPLTALGEADHR